MDFGHGRDIVIVVVDFDLTGAVSLSTQPQKKKNTVRHVIISAQLPIGCRRSARQSALETAP